MLQITYILVVSNIINFAVTAPMYCLCVISLTVRYLSEHAYLNVETPQNAEYRITFNYQK